MASRSRSRSPSAYEAKGPWAFARSQSHDALCGLLDKQFSEATTKPITKRTEPIKAPVFQQKNIFPTKPIGDHFWDDGHSRHAPTGPRPPIGPPPARPPEPEDQEPLMFMWPTICRCRGWTSEADAGRKARQAFIRDLRHFRPFAIRGPRAAHKTNLGQLRVRCCDHGWMSYMRNGDEGGIGMECRFISETGGPG